jgi:hypothetical protein
MHTERQWRSQGPDVEAILKAAQRVGQKAERLVGLVLGGQEEPWPVFFQKKVSYCRNKENKKIIINK